MPHSPSLRCSLARSLAHACTLLESLQHLLAWPRARVLSFLCTPLTWEVTLPLTLLHARVCTCTQEAMSSGDAGLDSEGDGDWDGWRWLSSSQAFFVAALSCRALCIMQHPHATSAQIHSQSFVCVCVRAPRPPQEQ